MKIAFIYILLLAAVTSCKKSEYYIYNDSAKIQFGPEYRLFYRTDFQYSDTSKAFTFFYDDDDKTADSVFFDIYAIGGITNFDRPFKIEQVIEDGVNNAVPGVHYVAFDSQEGKNMYVIKADSMHARIPIVMLRDPSLKDTAVTLSFAVAVNENFELGDVRFTWRKLEFTDRLSRPNSWDNSFVSYFGGAYSRAKHQFMIDACNQRWDDAFITKIKVDYAELSYWLGVVDVALARYNAEHPGNPLRDENGELIVFP